MLLISYASSTGDEASLNKSKTIIKRVAELLKYMDNPSVDFKGAMDGHLYCGNEVIAGSDKGKN